MLRCIEPRWCPPGATDTFDNIHDFIDWCRHKYKTTPILDDRASKGAEWWEWLPLEGTSDTRSLDPLDSSSPIDPTIHWAGGRWRLVLERTPD